MCRRRRVRGPGEDPCDWRPVRQPVLFHHSDRKPQDRALARLHGLARRVERIERTRQIACLWLANGVASRLPLVPDRYGPRDEGTRLRKYWRGRPLVQQGSNVLASMAVSGRINLPPLRHAPLSHRHQRNSMITTINAELAEHAEIRACHSCSARRTRTRSFVKCSTIDVPDGRFTGRST